MPRLAAFDSDRFKQTVFDVYYSYLLGQLDQRGIKGEEGGGGHGYYFKLKKFEKNLKKKIFFWSIQ